MISEGDATEPCHHGVVLESSATCIKKMTWCGAALRSPQIHITVVIIGVLYDIINLNIHSRDGFTTVIAP
jgi:hypothetical protein